MKDRYVRQTSFRPIGKTGQNKLLNSTITIIGCGALGTANAASLVRAGVGKVHIVDHDYVEPSNLHRQQLFTEQDATQFIPKVIAAKKRLQSICSDVELCIHIQYADSQLIEKLAKESDLIIDATDNFETRLVINDAAYKYNIPWIYGACLGSVGTIFPFVPSKDPCFRCLFPNLPPINESCHTSGIIPPTVHVVAAMQSGESLKILTNHSQSIREKIFYFDLWGNDQLEMGVSQMRDYHCQTCGDAPTYPSLSIEQKQRFRLLCGGNTVQISAGENGSFTWEKAELISREGCVNVKETPYFIMLFYEKHRVVVFKDGRILIHGVENINQAQRIYQKLFD